MPRAPSPQKPLLSAKLLGPPEFSVAGRPLAGRAYLKLQALFGFVLTEHDRPHTRDALAALLWPSHDKEGALRNLRLALHHVRQALAAQGLDLIASDRRNVWVIPGEPFLLDVIEFCSPLPQGAAPASIEHRIALYRGDFMSSVVLPDCDEFEAWKASQGDRLRAEVLQLLGRLTREWETRGDLERAVQAARRSMQIDPWNESTQRQLMRLLARSGHAEAAVAHFHAYESRLLDELGTYPEAATVALREQIQHGGAAEHGTPPEPVELQSARQLLTIAVIRSGQQPKATDDPEQWAQRISGLTKRLAALVHQQGGRLDTTPDGKWVAVFGFPRAEEGSAQRAVLAALQIARLRDDDAGPAQFGVGVHTALALIQGNHADAGGIVTTLASCHAHRAEPGVVCISAATERQTRGQFEVQRLDGGSAGDDGAAYAVLRPTDAVGRLERAPLTRLHGRGEELERLFSLWHDALQGRPQAVMLTGEAGIGKSRLVRTVREQLRQTGGAAERILRCRAEFRETPYHPFIALIASLAGSVRDEPEALRLAALGRVLDEHGQRSRDDLPVLARLLGWGHDPGIEALTSAQIKEQTEQAILTLLFELAQRRPVLLVCEDLHWGDPSTIALLKRLRRELREGHRMLLLVTSRSDHNQPECPDIATVELPPLGAAEVAAMVRDLAGGQTGTVLPAVVRLADGVPLFLEELTQALIEKGPGAVQVPQVPQTLLELLATRLDHLAEHKATAQLVAVLGREFTLDLVAAVFGVSAPGAASRLQVLVERSVLVRAEDGNGTRYQFRHALLQEAAYASQLTAARQTAHQRVAETLATRFRPWAARHPEQVARHFTQAGAFAQAIPWWLAAGRSALRTSANAEAVQHLRTGLRLNATLPADDQASARELEFLLPLGQALLRSAGYGSAEAVEVYDRAMDLCQHRRASPLRFEALWGQWMVSSSRPESSFAASSALAQELLDIAWELDDPALLIYAHTAAANVAFWRAEFAQTCAHARAAVALKSARAHQDRFDGHDPVVASLAYMSWALYYQGSIDEARAASARSVALAQGLDDPDSHCFALVFAAVLHRWMDEPDAVVDLTRQAMDISNQYGLALWQASGAMLMGWVKARGGDPSGLDLLNASLAGVRQAMPGVLVSFLHPLAEAHGFLGDHQAQLQVVAEALQACERLDEHFHRTDLHRLEAQALDGLGRRREAMEALRQARNIGSLQGAHCMTRRASQLLADWLRAEGKTDEAEAILRPQRDAAMVSDPG